METTGLVAKVALALKQRLDVKWKKAERDWVDSCLMLSSQTSLAVVTALLAAAMGRQPHDDEVQDALGKITDDPSFVPRLHRLFSELLRSPSVMRRKRLAAVLIGGLTITGNAADRDRLDLLAEQLLEEDIVTLQEIVAALEARAAKGDKTNIFRAKDLMNGQLGINTAAPGSAATGDVEKLVDPLSLDRLTAAYCVSQDMMAGMTITNLGKFLWKHMDHVAIRAGLGAGGPGGAVR